MATIWRRVDNSLPNETVMFRDEEEVVGVNHRLAAALSFANGENPELEFKRDPSNSADPNAIKIIGHYTLRGLRKSAHIGFVSKDVARLIVVYADDQMLYPNLKVIWQGDDNKKYLLIKYDILQKVAPAAAAIFEDPNVPARKEYLPEDYDKSFEWWMRRSQNGGQFPYVCPSCGTLVPIRKRIVVSKRSCPKCKESIELATIDFLVEDSEKDRLDTIKKESDCGCTVLITIGMSLVSGAIAACYLVFA